MKKFMVALVISITFLAGNLLGCATDKFDEQVFQQRCKKWKVDDGDLRDLSKEIRSQRESDFHKVLVAVPRDWEKAMDCIDADPELARDLLFYAVDDDKVDLIDPLMAAGACVNRMGSYGAPPLFYATSGAMVKKLVGVGADVNALSSNGWTCLEWAVLIQRFDVARALTRCKATQDPSCLFHGVISARDLASYVLKEVEPDKNADAIKMCRVLRCWEKKRFPVLSQKDIPPSAQEELLQEEFLPVAELEAQKSKVRAWRDTIKVSCLEHPKWGRRL